MENITLNQYCIVDKQPRIMRFLGEEDGFCVCNGEMGVFKVPSDRCRIIDDEFAIIMNTKGISEAMKHLRENGYFKPLSDTEEKIRKKNFMW